MAVLPNLKIGTFEIRDFGTIVFGSLSMVLAYLAIRLGRQQAIIARHQLDISQSVLGYSANVDIRLQVDLVSSPRIVSVRAQNCSPITLTIRSWAVYTWGTTEGLDIHKSPNVDIRCSPKGDGAMTRCHITSEAPITLASGEEHTLLSGFVNRAHELPADSHVIFEWKLVTQYRVYDSGTTGVKLMLKTCTVDKKSNKPWLPRYRPEAT
jgi:hypothetical protein